MFHWFMILLLLGIAFCIGGFLFYLLSLKKETAMDETMGLAQQKFIVGGVIGVILVIFCRMRKD